DEAAGWRTQGFLRMNGNRLAAAVESLEKAKTLAPADPETLYYLTVCLAELGRTDEADTEAAGLLRAAPRAPHSFPALGLLREKQARPADAAAAYRQALTLDPKDRAAADALKRLGG